MSARREVYADHAATTRPDPDVVAAMAPYLGDGFGNASSVHGRGQRARDAVDRARRQVADLVGAAPEEIVFTATGSEANNLALQGVLGVSSFGGPAARRRLIVSAIEHPSVLETAGHLEALGARLDVVPVGADGVVDPDEVAKRLGADVALVSVMLVNNEIGTLQPVAEIAALARAAGARMHCDAVQAAGKLALDVDTLGVDLLTLAGHKFGGPAGAAALYVRRRTPLVGLVHGGHQERSRRAGTENLPALVGFGVAAERAAARASGPEPARLAALSAQLLEGLERVAPGVRLNGDRRRRAPGFVNVRFEGADGEAVLHELDAVGITVSTGSACSAASPGPSHVLLALGLEAEEAHASVRFSLGESNDASDIATILDHIPAVLERLRALDAAHGERRA